MVEPTGTYVPANIARLGHHDRQARPPRQGSNNGRAYPDHFYDYHVWTCWFLLIYQENFGGVIAISRQQFEKVGGFSNVYFGWGGEDDDFYKRIIYQNYSIVRYPAEIGRYIMLRHERDSRNEPNERRFDLLESAESRFNIDGYWTSNYTIIKAHSLYNGLIYWISVAV
ncbi:unnamed protein product [Schistosoma margrebowiei]|uniref:Uncharacterized protein n=1 Tax=Schistosoma margrebowiei TaxID=48269 RepID=A0A183N977_9TREM|nr:unnamed protein product [Schistosoma margrebowiei]